jgi:hypothetical protein
MILSRTDRVVETGPRTVVVDEGSDLEVSRALANATGQSKVGDGEGLVRGGELEDPSLVLLELACLDVSILVELRLNRGASSHLCSGGSSPHLRPGDRPSKQLQVWILAIPEVYRIDQKCSVQKQRSTFSTHIQPIRRQMVGFRFLGAS